MFYTTFVHNFGPFLVLRCLKFRVKDPYGSRNCLNRSQVPRKKIKTHTYKELAARYDLSREHLHRIIKPYKVFFSYGKRKGNLSEAEFSLITSILDKERLSDDRVVGK